METDYLIRDISESECNLPHYHVLFNSLDKSPFPETTPWRVIQCSHYEGWQVNIVQMLVEYMETDGDEELPSMAITVGWQEPCVFIVTCWSIDNRNVNKVCYSKEEADFVFEVYSRYMIKEASTK